MYYMFFTRKQKKDKELSKDMFRVFQHKLSCHVSSVLTLELLDMLEVWRFGGSAEYGLEE